jgi:hypothetical protein
MENKDISQIALEKIRESGIKPISKNVFNIKRVIFWSLVSFSVIIGAVSFAIVLSILFTNDWYLYNKLGFGFIFKSLPYFWFLSLLIFTILGDFYYRRTSLGYRHRTITIMGVYIILTIVSGSVLHVIGMGKIVEDSLSRNIPIYRGFMFDKSEIWSHPEKGLLSGEIIEANEDFIKVLDSNGDIWILNIERAFVGKKVKIKSGEMIKILGDIDENNVFTVEQIRPWIGNGNNMVR